MLAHNFGAKFQKYIRRKMVLQKKIENNEQDATEKSIRCITNVQPMLVG